MPCLPRTSQQSRPVLSLSITIIDCKYAKVIDKESNRMDQRWIRKAMHVRKKQVSSKTVTRSHTKFFYIYDNLFYSPCRQPLTATLTKRLDAAHHRWQRSILSISWKDRITNIDVRARTGQQTMDNILREIRLRWLGHVLHMDHQRIPQQAQTVLAGTRI